MIRSVFVGALCWTLAAASPAAHAHEVAAAAMHAAAPRVLAVQAPKLPAADLIDTRGRTVALEAALPAGVPLVVNFVYTTCSTICSTQTATLAELQRRLDADGRRARFVSFTIDPDNDTPQQLAAFARRFGIARDWDFYSGAFDQLLRVQQAFDVYRGSKANHPPVVLMRAAGSARWTRVEGYPSAAELLALFERLQPSR